MDVKVEHDLAPRTLAELLQRHAVSAEHVHADLRDLLRDLHDMGEIVRVGIEDVAHLGLRKDERVTGRARHDVEEGEGTIILVDFITWNLAAQNFGKNVVRIVGGHGVLPSNSSSTTGVRSPVKPR